MLNAMSLLSRFSRWRENQMDRVVLNMLPGLEDKIHAGIADAGCKRVRLAWCALKELVQCAGGCQDWPGRDRRDYHKEQCFGCELQTVFPRKVGAG